MTVSSAQEAKALGHTKFFTGKPCKRGHVADRYANGGACVECIAEATGRTVTLDQEARSIGRAERLALFDKIPEHRLRAHQVDVPALQAMATLLCLARCPTLTAEEVRSHKAPTNVRETNGMFCFRFPPEFYEMMRAQANTLFGAHVDPAEIARTRAAITRNASDIALEERAAGQPGEWKFS